MKGLCPPQLQVPKGGKKVAVWVQESGVRYLRCSYGVANIDIQWNAPDNPRSLIAGNCKKPTRVGETWSDGEDFFSDEFQFAKAASGEYFLQVTGQGYAGPNGEPRLDVLKDVLAKAEAAMFALECDYQREPPAPRSRLMGQGVKDSLNVATATMVPPTIFYCGEAAAALVFGAAVPPAGASLVPPTASACLASATTMIGGAFAALVDPPDRRYARVATTKGLPGAPNRLTKGQRVTLCQLVKGKPACQRLSQALERYLAALAWQAEVATTAAVGANRFNAAASDADADGQALQRAAFKTYMGMLRLSTVHLQRWSRELRRVFPWNRSNPRLTGSQVAQAKAALLRLDSIPATALGFMKANGFDTADVRNAVRAADRVAKTPNQTLSLKALLAKRVNTSALRNAYESVTLAEVGLLVEASRRQGGIPRSTATALQRHLAGARAATTPSQRRAVLKQFLKTLLPNASTTLLQRQLDIGSDSPSLLPRSVKGFLWIAAAPLAYR